MKRAAVILGLALIPFFMLAGVANAAGTSPMIYWGTPPLDPFEVVHPKELTPDREILTVMDRYNSGLSSEARLTILEAIVDSSTRHGLDPLLVASVIAAESSFRVRAVSRCGARGLMQLTRMVWHELGVTDPFDPGQNIEGGCRFLATQIKRFGRVDLSLAAYNAGPGIVARIARVPHYAETLGYVKKVSHLRMSLARQYESRRARVETEYRATHYQSTDPATSIAPPTPAVPRWEPAPNEPIDEVPVAVPASPVTSAHEARIPLEEDGT